MPGLAGVELFKATFTAFEYAFHTHDTVALGQMERGTQQFGHGGRLHRAEAGSIACFRFDVVTLACSLSRPDALPFSATSSNLWNSVPYVPLTLHRLGLRHRDRGRVVEEQEIEMDRPKLVRDDVHEFVVDSDVLPTVTMSAL